STPARPSDRRHPRLRCRAAHHPAVRYGPSDVWADHELERRDSPPVDGTQVHRAGGDGRDDVDEAPEDDSVPWARGPSMDIEFPVRPGRRVHEEIDRVRQLPLLDVVRCQCLEEIHAAAPVVRETEALPVEGGAAGAEEEVVDADVIAHDLEDRLPVLV